MTKDVFKSLKNERVLVTAGLPYGSGVPHIGNLASLITADILARYYKISGAEAYYVSGFDEHGTPIMIKALRANKTPKEFVDENYEKALKEINSLNLDLDSFIRTSSELHKKTVQEFFKYLLDNGYIEIRKAKCFYDPKTKQYLPDRFVKGICPFCGSEAHGDHCDHCGRIIDPEQLKEPRSTISSNKIELVEVPHVFFKLTALKEAIKDYITKELKFSAQGIEKYVLDFLENIRDWDISRNIEWGIPVPLDELKDQVFYVWFDAFIGYVTAIRAISEELYERVWKSKDFKIIHVIGKDIVYHHAILWIGMLLGAEVYNLPKAIYTHGHLLIKGEKISKSRGNLFYARYLVDANINPDYIRYYVSQITGKTIRDLNLDIEDFKRKSNDELFANYVNLAYRIIKLIQTKCSSKIEKREISKWVFDLFDDLEQYHNSVTGFNYPEALKILMKICKQLNKYINEKEIWKQEDPSQDLYDLATAIVWLSILYWPFVPYIAGKILSMFSIEPRLDLVLENLGDIKVSNVEKIIDKISDDQIKVLVEKMSEKGEYCTIDDLGKIKLIVGKIVDVEKIGKKLYKLKVFDGTKERTIVSGIAEYYKEDELKGKNIVLVSNLEPKKIMGVVSEGMLLAAEKDGKVSLLTTDKDIEPGAEIH